MLECYNIVIVQQFEEFYKSENDKEKELERRLEL